MATLINALKDAANLTFTENGAKTHKTTKSKLYDLFALGGAYREHSDADVLKLFIEAFEENPDFALKCLFYLRDVRGGQGERRFFRLCYNWLAQSYPNAASYLMKFVPEMGRWDDLFVLFDTECENDLSIMLTNQLICDLNSDRPSLLAKWMKSENTSSKESRMLGAKLRQMLELTPKEYRKLLSSLRKKIRIVESDMSQDHWDDIEFDKLPSKAGLLYSKAFARHDETAERYREFLNNKNAKVNAGTLYPYEVVGKALRVAYEFDTTVNAPERLAVNKYWENLTDYFKGSTLDALCVVDTSGSMSGRPMEVAISLGMYTAERNNGPWHNHFITFSRKPKLVKIEGEDFVDKVSRIEDMNICENTDLRAVFDLILYTWHQTKCTIPSNLIIISDMQFDAGTRISDNERNSLLENIRAEWARAGLEMPHLIYWNVNAYDNNIPDLSEGMYSYVSGFSPAIFQTIMTGKTGYELMMETLKKDRYSNIYFNN